MPNKDWDKLDPIDRKIRLLSPEKGMASGPQIRITLIRGFELFNTRPYHNYETWSDGYIVEAFKEGSVIAKAEAEDLDDALEALSKKLN